MKEIKNILALPPMENETRRQTMQVLQVILILFSFISLIYSILSSITDFQNWGRYVGQGGFLLFCMLLGLVYLRKGYVRLVATLEILVIWLVFTAAAYTGGGVRSSGYFGYLVVLVIAGVISGKRLDTMVVVFLCAGVGYYLVYAESNGTLPPSRVPMTPFALWLDSLLYFSIIAVLLFLTMSIIQNALQRLNRELSERQRAEEMREELIKELEQRNSELERLAYTLSHELKSPLITIGGFVGYLRKDVLSGDINKLDADIQRIAEGTEKMRHLTNELVELMSIGRIVQEAKEISLRDLVDEAVALLQVEMVEKNITVYIADDLPHVYGEQKRLMEVFQNLLENSIKFMGEQSEPRIEIGLRNELDGTTIIFVRDNGMGIEPRHFNRIFGIFQKLDTQSEGTGIGLALVKRIIEVHGGRMWVESEGLGKGSTFCFTIPNKADDQS
jgi:signal transduction histidine kinase